MYNNSYEEYMRNSLGYNQMPMMNMNQMPEMYETEENYTCNQASVEDMYPEIYRIIYPMICKSCMAVNENITEDLVSRITNEVYINVEHMEIPSETRSQTISIAPQTNKTIKSDNRVNSNNNNNNISNNRVNNVRQETRQRNPLLNDLIRILVLRELIGNPGRPRPPFRPPVRPPFGPGPGPRPPLGGGPGMPRQDYPYMF